MHLVEAYKSLGLIGIALTVIGLVFLVLKWPQGRHMTFSQHAAAQQVSIFYYILLMCSIAPFYVLFFFWWLVPTFSLSFWFSIFVLTSMFFQLLCTLVPELPGWKYTAHRFFAFISAFLLMPTLAVIVLSSQVSEIARIISLCMILIMFSIMGFFYAIKVKHKYLLLFQLSYFVCFFVAILSTTYLR
ncbi:MAG TPA: hypothetical protein VMR76_00090 [Candidatus Saccharimonadia bacterium]|nr:hypothetical protein [Candidatus Saccharimonadia bacterium]